MDKTLVFDISGDYAHYRKIFATTSQLSYIVPSKTSLYGYIGAILGLDKVGNEYLKSFVPGECHLAIQIMKPIVMQRINTNLRAVLGRMKASDNRKPTMIEYVYKPKYRIYFKHKKSDVYNALKQHLSSHTAVYTPSMGLANLISHFKYIGEFDCRNIGEITDYIDTVIPREAFVAFQNSFSDNNEIVELSQYALEMDTERNVTARTDLFLDRSARSIKAQVHYCTELELDSKTQRIIFF
jgi:CRISPR-associated protein Cas5h